MPLHHYLFALGGTEWARHVEGVRKGVRAFFNLNIGAGDLNSLGRAGSLFLLLRGVAESSVCTDPLLRARGEFLNVVAFSSKIELLVDVLDRLVVLLRGKWASLEVINC